MFAGVMKWMDLVLPVEFDQLRGAIRHRFPLRSGQDDRFRIPDVGNVAFGSLKSAGQGSFCIVAERSAGAPMRLGVITNCALSA
jgi:hypothetical protein